jgi:hypothetical protein
VQGAGITPEAVPSKGREERMTGIVSESHGSLSEMWERCCRTGFLGHFSADGRGRDGTMVGGRQVCTVAALDDGAIGGGNRADASFVGPSTATAERCEDSQWSTVNRSRAESRQSRSEVGWCRAACLRALREMSKATLNATGKVLRQINRDSRCHIIGSSSVLGFLRTFGAGNEPQERVSRRKQGR